MSLAEVENMAALQSFTVGKSGGMLSQEMLGVLRCILVHSEAYREHTECLEKMLIILIIIACQGPIP